MAGGLTLTPVPASDTAVGPGKPFDNGIFEIFTEPMPPLEEGAEPLIAGVPLSEIQALTTSSTGAWELSRIRDALTTS